MLVPKNGATITEAVLLRHLRLRVCRAHENNFGLRAWVARLTGGRSFNSAENR